ncbi:MAG: methyltransferase domain-containing protein [Candidatus Dojkabacteria bacterium]|jgi:SAM-dependent methyltransferase|nr:methyltransferase domain-containing protein [Candidatus Dojkabacteria bacterium]
MKNTWENFYKTRGRFYLLRHPDFGKVIRKLKAYRTRKVLDLGCGSGRHLIELARNGFTVTGVDFSKEALNLAEKWAKSEKLKITTAAADIHKKLKFKDDSFDAVLAIDSLHYSNSENFEKSLKEIGRVVRLGGIVFITTPTTAGNPLVSHLIFTRDEIFNLMNDHFKVIDSFTDKRKFLCVFCAVSK